MFTEIILVVAATVVATLAGVFLIVCLNKRRRGIEMEALMKQLSDKPQRTFKNGKREYLVAFIKGRECDSERCRIPVQEHWKEINKMSDFEKQFHWAIFCDIDIRTIERFIEINPAITVLNLPTESPDFKTTNCMYKIIRVK